MEHGHPYGHSDAIALDPMMREGVHRGQKSMYVTLAASRRDLGRVADSHGWDP